jgi:hypothetical protein
MKEAPPSATGGVNGDSASPRATLVIAKETENTLAGRAMWSVYSSF